MLAVGVPGQGITRFGVGVTRSLSLEPPLIMMILERSFRFRAATSFATGGARSAVLLEDRLDSRLLPASSCSA